MRRIIRIEEKRATDSATPIPADIWCPFIHGELPAKCEMCQRIFSPAEIAEWKSDLNGDDRCERGLHIPRICESCGMKEFFK